VAKDEKGTPNREERSVNHGNGKAQGDSQGTRLLRLLTDVELFHTPDGEAYATINVAGHRENWPVRSSSFQLWLSRLFYMSEKTALDTQSRQAALGVVEAQAKFDGSELQVYNRVAEWKGNIYVDLGDPSWQVVEISSLGWSIVSNPPVRFIRSIGMRALPTPEHGGSISLLRPFVNLTDNDWILFVCWVIEAMWPRGPYPILCLQGEQGTAKTTLARVARLLLDPFKAPMRSIPHNERDLFISASNSHIISIDNISYLPPWFSDASSRLATGGGLTTRRLWTDGEEHILEAQRPILLNGINEIGVNSDFLDRSLVLSLPEITEKERKDDDEFWAEFAKASPLILGAFLNGVSAALRNYPTVKLERKPRMAGFAKLGSAVETDLGFKAGEFIDAYNRNRKEASHLALESSAVALQVYEFMKDKTEWEGTHLELLRSLRPQESGKGYPFPMSPKSLSNVLTRFKPNLRTAGITIRSLPRKAVRRCIRLEKRPAAASPSSPPSPPSVD